MRSSQPCDSLAALGSQAGARAAAHIDHAFRAILRGPMVTANSRVIRLITGAPHPFANFAVISQAEDPGATSEAIGPLSSCGAPAAVLTTFAPPRSMELQLREAGFEPHDGLPAMAVEIERLAPTPLPAGYSFAAIEPADRQAWGEAFAAGYELPGLAGEQFAAGVGQPNIRYYAIRKAGRMVCTSLMFLHDRLAGIYGVATLPEERRKGLGAFATAEPLRQAIKLGYRVGVLQASAAGHPVYRQLGFNDLAVVSLFVRVPPSEDHLARFQREAKEQ